MTAGSISPPYIIPLRAEQSLKSLIDTNTLIEIRCETNDVDIYYTLDGSKPDAFVTLASRRSTIQYRKPFYIPRELVSTGKVIIKAIAVSRNGVRESVIGTRMFDIKLVPSDHAQSDEYENRYLDELQQERKELMRRVQLDHEQTQRKLAGSMHRSSLDSLLPQNPYSNSPIQSNRLPKQTDPLRCAHCFAPKTSNSYTRFCTECGLPWQKLTHTPPEHHSINICSKCQSTIPLNSKLCVVCETPVGFEQQNQRTNVRNQPRILCPQCKSGNPSHLRQCYVCESNLLPTSTPPIRASVSVPSEPKVSGTMMTCSKCSRLNNADARFCDWCGAHPERLPMPIQCTKCRSTNDSNARFCLNCGCAIEPPLRVIDARIRNDSNLPASSMIASTLTNHSANPTWLNANATLSYSRQPSSPTKGEAATQTYGIYYPSAKDLDLVITQNKQLQEEREFKDKQPVLTSVSPGKGYWKQQLEHVCAHLKTYATNQPDFRALIGEPRMGKMVHATIHETDHQVTIQTVFRKPENLSQPSSSSFYINDRTDHYPMNSERSSAFSSAFNSDEEYTIEKPRRTKGKKRPKKRPSSATIASHTDSPNHALIKLLETSSIENDRKRSSHHLDIYEEVQRLLKDKKADGNCRNKDTYTALQLAVRNGHYKCLTTLIKDGKAKLDLKGPRGNTALHECCLLGINGVEPLGILLKHGGDTSVLNDKKESVLDLASKQNCQELLQVIAKYKGEQMVKQQEKHYYDDRARMTRSSDK